MSVIIVILPYDMGYCPLYARESAVIFLCMGKISACKKRIHRYSPRICSLTRVLLLDKGPKPISTRISTRNPPLAGANCFRINLRPPRKGFVNED